MYKQSFINLQTFLSFQKVQLSLSLSDHACPGCTRIQGCKEALRLKSLESAVPTFFQIYCEEGIYHIILIQFCIEKTRYMNAL